MVTEKHLNDIEEASDVLFESIQRAIAVREAIHELGQRGYTRTRTNGR